MALGARGEGHIELLDENGNVIETVQILFTNRAIAEAERLTGKSIFQLLNAVRQDAVGIGEMAQLLAVGMEAARREAQSGSRSLTINDAYRVMDHVGWKACAAVVYPALTAVFAYDQQERLSNPPA